MLADIDDGSLARLGFPLVLGNQTDNLVQVQDRAKSFVALEMEGAHADFTEVARMILVEIDPVVVLATGVSATSGMLPVLADPAVAMRDVASQLPGLLLGSCHDDL